MANKTGRPRKLDFEVELHRSRFESYCQIHCTEIEIASLFEVDIETLNRACLRYYKHPFADVFKEKSAGGKSSLRRRMFKAAMDGNISMMIFLAKNHLGMKDIVEQTGETKNAIKLTYAFRGKNKLDPVDK